MSQCRLCLRFVEDAAPFCHHCGDSRISESLAARVEIPAWMKKCIVPGVWFTLLFFLFTVGVAFLREARALRWGREALEEGNPTEAYEQLTPFVKAHPGHSEALFLTGQAALWEGHSAEAFQHYTVLRSMEGKRAQAKAESLEVLYGGILIAKAGQLSCGQTDFAAFYGLHKEWGEPFEESLLQGAASLAGKCAGYSGAAIANEPGYWLIHGAGVDSEIVIDSVYLAPAEQAKAAGDYLRMKHLAVQAVALDSEVKEDVARLVAEDRQAFRELQDSVRDLCESIADSPENRQGNRRCFPAEAPAEIGSLGESVGYLPSYSGSSRDCAAGFQLFSWEPEGPPPPAVAEEEPEVERQRMPSLIFTFRSTGRSCRAEHVDSFWSAG